MNDALYKWFTVACSENVYPGRPELMEKAKEVAEKLRSPIKRLLWMARQVENVIQKSDNSR